MRTMRTLCVSAAVATLGISGVAFADPGDEHGHDEIPVPAPTQPLTPAGASGWTLLGASDKDGTTNSDLAFYKNLAFAGNYDGFRVVDIKRPDAMRVLSDVSCRSNQGDVSVFKTRDDRVILLQSIDRPVDAPDCTGKDTALIGEDEFPDGTSKEATGTTPAPGAQRRNRARFGFEGLRMFDVTDPTAPKYLKFIRTACGSHTHTLVPDKRNGMVHAYVASYPLGGGITPQVDRAESDGLGLTCVAPHRKISVVSIPLEAPESATVKEKALSSDTEPYDGDGPARTGADGKPQGNAPAIQACHDHQAFMPRNIVIGSCAGDAQYWDVSQPANPTSGDGEAHTHIKRENGTTESFDFIHNAVGTWDGKVVAISDESGGGGEPRCDGDNSKRGFTFFYPLVTPGAKVDGFADLRNQYMTPRPQNTEVCVSHNGSVLPTRDGRYQMVQAFYQGGNSFYDFTAPGVTPTELGFADLEDGLGKADSWSTYFYNGVVFVNGGLNRRGTSGNRGLEAYRVDGIGKTKKWQSSNPQTQEVSQVP